jgi:hypothetical protein
MKNSEEEKTGVEKAGKDLFNFAVDREDVKVLVANLPEDAGIRGVTAECELQILKIISLGWSISYYKEDVMLPEVRGSMPLSYLGIDLKGLLTCLLAHNPAYALTYKLKSLL